MYTRILLLSGPARIVCIRRLKSSVSQYEWTSFWFLFPETEVFSIWKMTLEGTVMPPPPPPTTIACSCEMCSHSPPLLNRDTYFRYSVSLSLFSHLSSLHIRTIIAPSPSLYISISLVPCPTLFLSLSLSLSLSILRQCPLTKNTQGKRWCTFSTVFFPLLHATP